MRAAVYTTSGLSLLFACFAGLTATAYYYSEWKSGVEWPEPAIVSPGVAGAAPADAIVLFDGKSLAAWEGVKNWTVEEGVATVGSTVTSKQKFGDCQLHLEFATPSEVSGAGQGRGNSGVYLMNRYELQILDSFNNQTYFDGQCGSIYKQTPPLVNVCRGPGEWQTYDIIFTAPHFNGDGTVKTPAYITVLQNGVLIQNHFELKGGTFWDQAPVYQAHADREPLLLQHHGNPIRFRNIWVRDLMAAK
jgi:hypothetical protein